MSNKTLFGMLALGIIAILGVLYWHTFVTLAWYQQFFIICAVFGVRMGILLALDRKQEVAQPERYQRYMGRNTIADALGSEMRTWILRGFKFVMWVVSIWVIVIAWKSFVKPTVLGITPPEVDTHYTKTVETDERGYRKYLLFYGRDMDHKFVFCKSCATVMYPRHRLSIQFEDGETATMHTVEEMKAGIGTHVDFKHRNFYLKIDSSLTSSRDTAEFWIKE